MPIVTEDYTHVPSMYPHVSIPSFFSDPGLGRCPRVPRLRLFEAMIGANPMAAESYVHQDVCS
jgi:hypothetical protein